MLDVERTSLQELARAELAGLYGFARQLSGTRAGEADDLVQETLLRACKSFAKLRDRQAGPKWLRVIMVNVWRDRLRSFDRTPEPIPVETQTEGDDEFSLYRTLLSDQTLPYSDTMHVDFVGAFSNEDIHLVLQRLREEYRVVLLLRYVEGFSTEEIADLLELPFGTVCSHLHRGRQQFEKAIWQYAKESDLLGRQQSSATKGDKEVTSWRK